MRHTAPRTRALPLLQRVDWNTAWQCAIAATICMVVGYISQIL